MDNSSADEITYGASAVPFPDNEAFLIIVSNSSFPMIGSAPAIVSFVCFVNTTLPPCFVSLISLFVAYAFSIAPRASLFTLTRPAAPVAYKVIIFALSLTMR